ncbi:MAG: hypothetical protein ACJ78Q_03450 [Chloroflexia bacterium]
MCANRGKSTGCEQIGRNLRAWVWGIGRRGLEARQFTVVASVLPIHAKLFCEDITPERWITRSQGQQVLSRV